MKDYVIDKIGFTVLLGLIAVLTAGVAAVFSVYGIATLFSGAFISVAIMAGVLEVAKLVTVVYLYRYWKKTRTWLATYLSLALVILMAITSLGIFGYLSAAYQKASSEYKSKQEQIVLVEKNKTYVEDRISQSQNRISMLNEMRKAQESRLSEALTNSFISRNAIQMKQIQDQTADMIKTTEEDIKTEQKKIEASIGEIQSIEKQVNEMRYSSEHKDIRTFEFVAKLFNTDLDTIAKWFIFLLIVVFDPLAIALILAYNVVINERFKNQSLTEEDLDIKKKVVRNTSYSFPFQEIPKVIPEIKEEIIPDIITTSTTTSSSTTTSTTTTSSTTSTTSTTTPPPPPPPPENKPDPQTILSQDPFYRMYFKQY